MHALAHDDSCMLMHVDHEDCGQWIENYEWHTDGDINDDFSSRPKSDSREDCIAQCDAYVPPAGGLPCNAVSYYSDSGACMKKNVGQYWPMNGPFDGGTRSAWIRCEGAGGQRGEARKPFMFAPDSAPATPTPFVAPPPTAPVDAPAVRVLFSLLA